MEIVSTIALISINGTLLAQLISFLIFLWIINRIMFRPLQGVMDERKSFVETIKLDTAEAAADFERLTDELNTKESAVRSEAAALRQEREELGSREAAEIRSSARQEIESIKEKTEIEVAAQVAEARKHLEKESEALAINIMEKVLDRRLVP
jgi:F-type H+-transporting ATPase subunit b